MKTRSRMMVALFLAGCFILVAGCITTNEEEKDHVLTWSDIARTIDLQLGMVSSGPLSNDCNGAHLALGTHCKDQLAGTVSEGAVKQYVEIKNDTVLFDGDTNIFDGDTAFWTRGLLLEGDPCTVNLDGGNTVDYLEVCKLGGQLLCADRGQKGWRLEYKNCAWKEEGPRTFTLNGVINVAAYVTVLNEQVVVQSFSNYTGLQQGTNATYTLNGSVVRYQLLDPFSGRPSPGTTGNPTDGMWILKLWATVDLDGPGLTNISRRYLLNAAKDDEDGWVFLSDDNHAVWLGEEDNSVAGTDTLRFYAKGRKWDGVEAGCLVDVSGLAPGTRKFDLAGLGTYPDTGCLKDHTGVTY